MPILTASIVLVTIAAFCPVRLGNAEELMTGNFCDGCGLKNLDESSNDVEGELLNSEEPLDLKTQEMEAMMEEFIKEVDNAIDKEKTSCGHHTGSKHTKKDLKFSDENNSEEAEMKIGVKIEGKSGEEEDVSSDCKRLVNADIANKYVAVMDKNVGAMYLFNSNTPDYQIGVRFNPHDQMLRYTPFALSYYN